MLKAAAAMGRERPFLLRNMRISARRYDDTQAASLEIEGGRIARMEPIAGSDGSDLPWVAPGFVDLQINGYGGQEFSSGELTAAKVGEIVAAMDPMGVVKFCPTITTNSRDVISHAVRTIAQACEKNPHVAARLLGIHIEGPYISPEDGPRGAHPREHCRSPDWAEFESWQRAAGGRIRLVTLSPEYPESVDFIRRATQAGVVVSIGHTAASGEQIRASVDAGARLSTHLGNGAHRDLPRHPNYLWDQMAEDRLMASLIVDGHHLPPEVVKTIVRAKSPERCILVSDLSGLAGLPAGRYGSGMCELEILDDGRLVIAGQRQLLAGASRPIGDGMGNMMRFAGLDLKTAVDMATANPCRLMGLPTPRLAAGEPADLVLFELTPEGRLRVKQSILGSVPAIDVK
jgi:N-acetylglucosamine-6-phosphate deacetylase